MAMGIIYVIIFVLFILLIFYLRTPKAKGKQGEKSASKLLSQLPPNEYTIYNDLLIPNGERTAQIDHVDLGDTRHTYCNVAVYGNNEYCVTSITGWHMGRFPYGDKFTIE